LLIEDFVNISDVSNGISPSLSNLSCHCLAVVLVISFVQWLVNSVLLPVVSMMACSDLDFNVHTMHPGLWIVPVVVLGFTVLEVMVGSWSSSFCS